MPRPAYRTKRTIRVRFFEDDVEVYSTVVNGASLAALRRNPRYRDDPRYRLEIEPAPDWEEVGRWEELEAILAAREKRRDDV
jgi:hypothetical protein